MEEIQAPKAPYVQPRLLMVFDGVLIGSAKTPNIYQIGVVPVPEHQFSIIITEFQKETITQLDENGNVVSVVVDSPISSREIKVSDLSPAKRRWTFEVNQAGQPPPTAATFDSGTTPNRLGKPPVGDPAKDYKWLLSLDDDKDFPLHGRLTKQAEVLNPIINFKNGLFYAYRLTNEVPKLFRKADGAGREVLGMICEHFVAKVEGIAEDAEMLLKDGAGEEIFKLVLKRERSFGILFQNMPPHRHPTPPGVRTHFPLFYSAFTPYKRYELVLTPKGFPGPSIPSDPQAEEGGPAPFRCGPVRVDVTLE